MRAPTILHADLDAFYASVEQRDDPSLRGKPVIVGMGVVLAASYEAKACGVRTAMGATTRARHLCPRARVVAPRMSAYSAASKAVFEVFKQTTPLVEGLSIDEAFLDVGGLRKLVGPAAEIASTLRREVATQVGLPITVGVARTKFLAKVASGVAKPDGLLVVPPDGELGFLHPLPIERLWGVGPTTAEKLRKRRVHTVGQVAGLPETELVALLGKAAGRHLHALAHNRDPRPIETGRRRRSVGAQRALGRHPRSADELASILAGLVDRVSRRLRTGGRACRTVVLRLRFDDFTRVTRSHTLAQPTTLTEPLCATAHGLLATAMPMIREHGITMIGVSLANLDDDSLQLPLPFDADAEAALDGALDDVRSRFGHGAVTRAALLRHGDGIAVPLAAGLMVESNTCSTPTSGPFPPDVPPRTGITPSTRTRDRTNPAGGAPGSVGIAHRAPTTSGPGSRRCSADPPTTCPPPGAQSRGLLPPSDHGPRHVRHPRAAAAVQLTHRPRARPPGPRAGICYLRQIAVPGTSSALVGHSGA
ncbi:MAG: DNA polymerase IV [Streptosporangiales bacterium]|nr:DNA polymerase IV [Streptosporangiales bacterium]